jgi:anti-sigma regulatory factor (Ser/Thr protein kinase)
LTEALPDALQCRVPTDLVYVRPVRKMVEGLLLAQGWTEENVEDAALVFTELLQNAIEHGSKGDGSERVEWSCRVEEGAVVFTVVDPGTGKDPQGLLLHDVTLKVPPDQARGRGLYLVNRLSAALERARDGCGCSIRVRLEADDS